MEMDMPTAADMRAQEIYDAGYTAGVKSIHGTLNQALGRIEELEEQLQMYRQDHRDRNLRM